MRIFKTSQEDNDDLLDIMKEHFREWGPIRRWRWGDLDRSTDDFARFTTDREHIERLKTLLSTGLGTSISLLNVEDNGGELILKWDNSFETILKPLLKLTRDENSYWWGGEEKDWKFMEAGTKVILLEEAQYSAGPDDNWRKTLKALAGQEGVIERVFPNSSHVNVDFEGMDGNPSIGIDKKYLIRA